MPVLPEVASTTVCPGFSVAALLGVLDDRDRQAVLDRGGGLKNSHLTYIVTPFGARRLMRTIGVRPMVPRMLS